MVEGHSNWTTMFLQILFLICSVCNTYGVASAASPSCASDEYRAGQLCCLACPGGYRVHRDCSATANTLCSKCPDRTFKEDLSGQKQCSACTQCGTGQMVKKRCTPTSDTECVILDGFFCSVSADKDTFSEATLSCQPHTICDSVGGVQMQPGTDSTDSTCIKYVAIVFIIIGCICFIILIIVLGALFYRWLKMERDLNEWEKLIPKMETPGQVEEYDALWQRLEEKKKTQKQQMKLDELFFNRYLEKIKTLDLDLKFIERVYRRSLKETEKPNRMLNEWIDALLKKEEMTNTDYSHELANQIREKKRVKEEQDGVFYKLIPQLIEEMKEQERKITDGAAGEGTSGPSSTPLLCPELPAGLETSSSRVPSSETQPAEETTPLMSSESESTRDQQEHTSRTTTPDVTMDDHDDDQSLDALAYRSGTGQIDIEMGPVQTLPKDRNWIL